jgi:hypothetical protein
VCPAVGQAPEVGAPPPCDDEFARFLVDQQVTESRGIEKLTAGMTYFVGDDCEAHRTSTKNGCKLFMVD